MQARYKLGAKMGLICTLSYIRVQIMVQIRNVVTPVFLIYTLFAPFCIKLNFLPANLL